MGILDPAERLCRYHPCGKSPCNTLLFPRHQLADNRNLPSAKGSLLETMHVVRQAVVTCSLLFVSVVLAILPAVASEIWHGPVIALGNSATSVDLSSQAFVACDASGDTSPQSAAGLDYASLVPDMKSTPECRGYWLRFAVGASSPADPVWILRFANPWRHIDLFTQHDGTLAAIHSGDALAPQDRVLPSPDMAMPLPVRAGTPQVFYLHLEGDTGYFGESRLLGATIVRLDRWLLLQRTVLFGQGIYTGTIVGLALFNFILFLAIRERVYLFYSIYVVSFATIWIARTGFAFQFLWPQHPSWDVSYRPFAGAFAIIFSTLFVREFLDTRRRSPLVDFLLRGVIIAVFLLCVANAGAVHFYMPVVIALIGLFLCMFYPCVAFVAMVRGYRPARLFLVAWTALLVGNAVYILMYLRVLPLTFFTFNAAQAGSAIECVLLAFALADRVDLLKRAREDKQIRYTQELQEQVAQRTGELTEAVEKLKTASATDPLTGLSNRRHVESVVRPWIADLQRSRIRNAPGETRRYLAICLADLDHFKLINDLLGHSVGDKVLQAASHTLRNNVRATAILARWGGEEFLVLDHVTTAYEDLLMAERLRQSIVEEASQEITDIGRPLSLSLGVVRYPFSDRFPDLLDWDHSLALADHALYGAKNAGRNGWQCYRANEEALADAIRERGEIEVRDLIRRHIAKAFSLNLLEVIDQVPSDVETV